MNAYKYNKKTHATMKKNFILLYLEHIRFLVKRAGWTLTRFYSHYSFEQECFQKKIVITNQVFWKKAKSLVKKDFYKLMNKLNFIYDCRHNIDNCIFAPISDELDEISYLKKHQNPFQKKCLVFYVAIYLNMRSRLNLTLAF